MHTKSKAYVIVCQVLLSSDDLKMMMDEVATGNSDDDANGPAVVNLSTFLLIMEHSSW